MTQEGVHKHIVDLMAVVAIGTGWNFQNSVALVGSVLGCCWFALQIYGWFSREDWHK